MKKIYLFLALAIAVAINANAGYSFHVWINGNSELYNAVKDNTAFAEDGTYTFSPALTITQPEMFLIKDGDTYYKGSICIPNSSWALSSSDKNYKENLVLAPGTYTSVSFDGTTLKFEGENITEYGYKLNTWNNGGNVLNALSNTYLKKIEDKKYELVFDAPITLREAEEFGFRNSANNWQGGYQGGERTDWIWVGGDTNNNMKLKPGTYYSVTLTEGTENGNYVKFNTYAETTTGLDALLSKSADYVGIATDIYVQEHHENYYSVYTTESSTYVAPRQEQDTKYYGDEPEKFEKRDWFRIWAPGETERNGKHFEAGTVVEIASGKAVKWGNVVSGETPFTPNLYRPLNFSATETEKDVMYIFQPQEGEVLQVRGKYKNEGGQEYLTDEKEEHKVGLLGFTGNKMTVGQWYTLDGHLRGVVVHYTGFATATGVESVETANATVFAANGTINVSSEAQAAIEVYTANGQMVRAINADNASIAVAPGFYLVKVGNQVSKVVVK